tara:strand:+ start:15727 stop:16173 length:447 start_codon:yes stop_codon:yes gene_type:complete
MINKKDQTPWTLKKIVLPQNTDHAGVMWHGAYLNWLEESRIDALSRVGLSYSEISGSGYEMPVVELNIKYNSSLIHGETVLLKSWILNQKGPRILWKTIFLKYDGKISAEALVNLVLLYRYEEGFRVLRKGPQNISKAIDALKLGPKD